MANQKAGAVVRKAAAEAGPVFRRGGGATRGQMGPYPAQRA
jgi:hypothetical protein